MAEKVENVLPNVVPASFVPKPEDFAPAVSQELRSQQAGWARSYALKRIEYFENQLRMSWFRREEKVQYSGEAESNRRLEEAIAEAKTVRTVMMDSISEWAGAYQKDAFLNMLPRVWDSFASIVRGEPAPVEEAEEVEPEAAPAVEEDALAPEEEEVGPEIPVLPSARYDDLASKPKSKVKAPDELSLGDLLGQLEKDNSES